MGLRDDEDTYEVESCRAIVETNKALLVVSETPGFGAADQEPNNQRWIPKSVLRDGNEVNKEGDAGRLVIALWFAEKEGID